jgi:hypothetical protein
MIRFDPTFKNCLTDVLLLAFQIHFNRILKYFVKAIKPVIFMNQSGGFESGD